MERERERERQREREREKEKECFEYIADSTLIDGLPDFDPIIYISFIVTK